MPAEIQALGAAANADRTTASVCIGRDEKWPFAPELAARLSRCQPDLRIFASVIRAGDSLAVGL